jgi:hypothetical protein
VADFARQPDGGLRDLGWIDGRNLAIDTEGQSRPNAPQQKVLLFDHIVRGGKQGLGNAEVKRFGCLEIDAQLELGRLLDGKISRLGSFEYFVHVNYGAADRANIAKLPALL